MAELYNIIENLSSTIIFLLFPRVMFNEKVKEIGNQQEKAAQLKRRDYGQGQGSCTRLNYSENAHIKSRRKRTNSGDDLTV